MGSVYQTMDGNTAAAYISYAFTEVAAIYPITPSSTMAEEVDRWAAQGKRNLFGNPVVVQEMQSEGGAAGAMHGSLQGGALSTTYTASQGLLLMIPNMYKMAGELLPAVFHVSARSLASNALSIFGDHQDVMSVRQTGFSLLASASVQECMDLGAVAHLTAIESRVPVLHFFDGFRTSHEVQKIQLLEYDDLAGLLDWASVDAFRARALNPEHPVLRGTTQNPDIFFQTREAVNKFYIALPQLFQRNMDRIGQLTGRNYHLFDYYGAPGADKVIVAMGSGCEVIRETIDYQNARGGNYGLLQVRLYRPFSSEHLRAALPKTTRRVAVLDRTKEPGAPAEPLFLDVRNAFHGQEGAPLIVGGRYGLASKDFTPADVMAVYQTLESDAPRDGFSGGTVDDVTRTSLPPAKEAFNPAPAGTTACKFWGLGSDGTVSANKSAVKIIGNHTDLNVQAYFSYDSKKSGGLTVSHLRFGTAPIRSSYLVRQADFIACHNQSYVGLYDLLEGMRDSGTFLLNCVWTPEELEARLPAALKRAIAAKRVSLYTINAVEIAKSLGLGGRINMIMQAAFFKLIGVLPEADAVRYLREAVEKNYGSQGPVVVERNYSAIDAGMSSLRQVEVPAAWRLAQDPPAPESPELPDFVERIVLPMARQQGDSLPVSAFNGAEDGTYPTGSTKYEKRAIALEVPRWLAESCIQCNQCAFVCPHAVLRPTLLTGEQAGRAPGGLVSAEAKGFAGMSYHLGMSALDCTGCGSCVQVCPAKQKALVMEPLADRREQLERNWAFVQELPAPAVDQKQRSTVKGSQFLQPLFEFSGACAGCGETPYAKLITQLFGERMMISNSAGCATVWGGSAPTVPYTVNARGHGPAWGFSLFEDNAEYGFGMRMGSHTVRKNLMAKAKEALEGVRDPELRAALEDWLAHFSEATGTRERSDRLARALEPHRDHPLLGELYKRRDYLAKRSNWIFGGDGWAYDIGYGGLDHVLASGEDINIMVFDTEVYSNTGGQSSKATPAAAIAKFAASGKYTKKKDLGMMAMSYGYVYVAQVAMGADKAQTLKAILEAEAYDGPSLIIGYAPCVNHGIKGGMGMSQLQQKRAVEAGYWSLYRHNPDRKRQGENPFILDSPEPTASFRDYLLSEVRYASLLKAHPQRAEELFGKAERDAGERLESYRRLASQRETGQG